ncbi:MAG TPA: ABC transporter ATP-binding protein [Tissierellaceae bacterium]|nr:ABC transporter ATP-binding protein [Tissierellaceae bacterium]
MDNKDTIGKAYDSKLMKRLLGYARPYWKLFLLSFVLLIIITGLELLNPYLLKVAIDDYINGNQKPRYEVDIDSPVEGIEFNNHKYVREADLEKNQLEIIEDKPIKRIIQSDNNYYLVNYDDQDATNGVLIDEASYSKFRDYDLLGVNRVSMSFFIVILFIFLFNYAQVYLLNYTGQRIIFNIREEIFNHIQNLSIGFFDKNPIGKLVTRVTNDTETLNEMYTSVLVNLFKDILMLLGIMIIMVKMNYKLALLSFALLPFILVVSIIFRNNIRVVYRLARLQLSKINSSLNEYLSGVLTIQIFNKENKISKKFDDLNTKYLDTAKREVKIYAMLRPSIEIIRSLGIATLIYFGGGEVISGAVEFGKLYIFIDYLQKFFGPIMELTEKYNILQSSMASSERIFDILDTETFINNSSNPVSIKDIKGKIEFQNVWFAYEDEDWVLKDISFTINSGETIALVGATGAGKSSIINLITRFYDIQYGKILLDDIDITDIDKYKLRQYIGVVLQDVFLFSGTIEDNIKLNNDNISREDIQEVAEFVNADKFINQLPKKYDEPIMERGSTLSSGERQLLSFARTLAYNPQILILDEATSNIDTETELLIQDALGKLVKDRTSIAIAHRLSTIQYADNIIVLSKGEIKEMGNHQELLELEGMYYDLYRLQYAESID